MPDLPVMLRVRGRRCVIVGGGSVARRRAAALLEAGASVTVIAPEIDAQIEAMPLDVDRRAYRAGDLQSAVLVVIATDNPAVNQQVADDARAAGVLVNRTDDPEQGDVSVPAHAHHGPVTLAVHTGGISAAAAATIRRELSAALDPDWPRLLAVVAPYRAAVQAGTPQGSRRQQLLARLTDAGAMATLKRQGEDALRHYCQAIADESAAAREPGAG